MHSLHVHVGLPNALGGYDETPEIMSEHLKVRLITVVFCGLQYPDEACVLSSMFAAEGSQSILLHYKCTFLMS